MARRQQSLRGLVHRLVGSRVGGLLHAVRWASGMPRHADPATWDPDHCILERFVSPGGVCVDVGASGGDWTYPMAKSVGPEGLVHAFDAFPYYARVLRHALLFRRVSNVKVHSLGLGDADGVREITLVDRDGTILVGKIHLTAEDDTTREKLEVPIRKLDTVMVDDDSFSRTVLLKIDVEGAELAIFRGARRMLVEVRPAIYCEVVHGFCERYGHRLVDVLNHVVGFGYRVQVLTDEGEFEPVEPDDDLPSANYLFIPCD